MSVVTTIELFCDECADSSGDPIYGHEGERTLRSEAKQEGWARQRIAGVMVDLCPLCKRNTDGTHN